ncbi:MAG: helix-turn-helix domain-containing protein [Candidatus Uhrbacteria bacterium]
MASSKELLTHFSVTDDEAEIYLTLLKLGAATATEISDKAKKNRTATHFHLKKLVDKNLVQLTKQGRTFMFNATAPSELATRFDRATTDFKSLVPQLEALQKIEGEAPRVQVTESRAGYSKVYDEISSLPEGDIFLAIEGAEALRNELTLLTNEETKNFYTKIINRGIQTKLILTKEAAQIPSKMITSENYNLLKKRRLDVRTHPEAVLPFQGLSLMYGDTVAYLFPQTNLVVTIKHQEIADSFKVMFGALFSSGEIYSFKDAK